MSVVIEFLKTVSSRVAIYIEQNLSDEIEVEIIRTTHGNKKDSPDWTKQGSYIYFLYNESRELVYIGETGVKIKNRLYTDGNGAHFKKSWFSEIKYVKYFKDDKMNQDIRKLIERALIFQYRNKFNLYNED